MQRSFFLVFTSFLLAAVGKFASAHYNDINNSMMMNLDYGYWGWFGWVFMLTWWILFISLIIAIIRWLLFRSRENLDGGRTALDILKERYAKGEIDKKEFEEKKKGLI